MAIKLTKRLIDDADVKAIEYFLRAAKVRDFGLPLSVSSRNMFVFQIASIDAPVDWRSDQPTFFL